MQPSQSESLVVFVDVKTILNIRPVHEIHLTASAQIYCVSIFKNVLAICQNDGIMSYYTCNYGGIEDEETPTDQHAKNKKSEQAEKPPESKEEQKQSD